MELHVSLMMGDDVFCHGLVLGIVSFVPFMIFYKSVFINELHQMFSPSHHHPFYSDLFTRTPPGVLTKPSIIIYTCLNDVYE